MNISRCVVFISAAIEFGRFGYTVSRFRYRYGIAFVRTDVGAVVLPAGVFRLGHFIGRTYFALVW